MSEKLHQHSPEQVKSPESHHENLANKHHKERHEKPSHTQEISKDSIDSIKHSIEQTALSSKDYHIAEKEDKKAPTHTATRHLKKDAYRRLIKKTQKQLNTPERVFSKIIHQPAVDKISEVGAKTIARPNGILFGGISAFIGSLFFYFVSKKSGFSYNYLTFILIFVGGYFIGLLFELAYKLLQKNKPAKD